MLRSRLRASYLLLTACAVPAAAACDLILPYDHTAAGDRVDAGPRADAVPLPAADLDGEARRDADGARDQSGRDRGLAAEGSPADVLVDQPVLLDAVPADVVLADVVFGDALPGDVFPGDVFPGDVGTGPASDATVALCSDWTAWTCGDQYNCGASCGNGTFSIACMHTTGILCQCQYPAAASPIYDVTLMGSSISCKTCEQAFRDCWPSYFTAP